MTATVPSEVALAELARVRDYARRQVAQGADKAMAEAHVAKWCAIAAWFGAALPDDLAMHDPIAGVPRGKPLWTDYAPPGTPLADWRHTLAQELRSYTQRAAARAEAESPLPLGVQRHVTLNAGAGRGPVSAQAKALERARNLRTLERYLSLAARLPAIGSAHPEPVEGPAMAPEQRKAA